MDGLLFQIKDLRKNLKTDTKKHLVLIRSIYLHFRIALIGAIVERSSSADPFYKFNKKYFLDENGFLGVNGIFRFSPNGNNEREVSVAEVKSGAFTVIDQAKTSFTK